MKNAVSVIPMPNKITYLGGETKIISENTKVSVDSSLGEEEYVLTAENNGVEIVGGSEKAVFYAKQTLRQLGGVSPCVKIEDKPAFGYRGFMLDTVRHIFSVEDTKKLIDAAASVKMNVMHWHLTDDQGWRIESKAFPGLHEISAYRPGDHFGPCRKDAWEGGYYTREEVKDFVAYCGSLGIQVIPEVDMPGHVRSILAAYPHLSCRGEKQPVVNKSAITFG